MKFDLLENGIDSLKAAGDILIKPDYYYEFKPFQLKDALFHFSHGVEILGKYLLKSNSEVRIFVNPTAYRDAIRKRKRKGLKSIYDADPGLETIGFNSTLYRLKTDRNFPLDNKLWKSLDEIRRFRNEMMHYSLELDEEEFLFFASEFRLTFAEVFAYFNKHISSFEEKMDSILRKDGLVEYQEYVNRIDDLRFAIQAENWDEVRANMMDALEDRYT